MTFSALIVLGYAINCLRYMTSSEPTEVIATSHAVFEPKNVPADYVHNIDRRMEATFALPGDRTASIVIDAGLPPMLGFIPRFPDTGFVIECERGRLDMLNHVLPTLYHYISVKNYGMVARVEKVYKGPGKGEEWWLTYRHQLEALVDKLRGREPETWLTKEDSVQTMEWIEKVYAKVRKVQPDELHRLRNTQSGLGSRPQSAYFVASRE